MGETTKVNLSKAKPKKIGNTTVKLDLSKKIETVEEVKEVKEEIKEEVKEVIAEVVKEEVKEVVEVKEEVEPVKTAKDKVTIEEVTKEEIEEEVKVVEKSVEKGVKDPLPEGVDKLVSFINDTGGDLQDYLRLNADYTKIDDETLIKEYYRKTKPHLDNEELDFVMEEAFHFDEDFDDERDVKLKKLAQKEEAVKAKSFLNELKDKYYEEIKQRPTQSNEQRKATDFFNRYQEDQIKAEESRGAFKSDTATYFKDEFKGFGFNVGEKRFNYKVSNPDSIAESQSSIETILGKFLDKDGSIKNLGEYHKAMYGALNIDKIAEHFYDQGAADTAKGISMKSKNISAEANRQTASPNIMVGGFKVKAVNGVDSSRLTIKKRQ